MDGRGISSVGGVNPEVGSHHYDGVIDNLLHIFGAGDPVLSTKLRATHQKKNHNEPLVQYHEQNSKIERTLKHNTETQ